MTNPEIAEVFKDVTGKWRWHRRAANGQITVASGESFEDHFAARMAAQRENPGLELRDELMKDEPHAG